jgi:hypothetical protein
MAHSGETFFEKAKKESNSFYANKNTKNKRKLKLRFNYLEPKDFVIFAL